MTKLKQNQFYCVACRARKKVSADDMCVKNYKNKRSKYGYVPALKASCKTCGTNMNKFIKHNDEESLTKKYGKC